MFNKIMFPTDFSMATNRIFDCINDFKRVGMTEAVFVHIVDERDESDVLQRTKWAEDAFKEYEERYKDEDFSITTIIRHGVPFIALNDIASKEAASLIVITSHGKSMIERMFLGSVAEKLIYHSEVPVLIEKVAIFEACEPEHCHEIAKRTFKHILFPTDWSECAQDVLNTIKRFKDIGMESVTVLHVMDVRNLKYHTNSKIKEFEDIDLEKLKVVKDELTAYGLNVETMLAAGIPYNEIKRAARETEITLVAMGVHGKGFIKEALLGSTAERVARHAFKPVLLLSHKKV